MVFTLSSGQRCGCGQSLWQTPQSDISVHHRRTDKGIEICAFHAPCHDLERNECPSCHEPFIQEQLRLSPIPGLQRPFRPANPYSYTYIFARALAVLNALYTPLTLVALGVETINRKLEIWLRTDAEVVSGFPFDGSFLKYSPYMLTVVDVVIRTLWDQLPPRIIWGKIPIHLLLKVVRLWHAHALYAIHKDDLAFSGHFFSILCEPMFERHFKDHTFAQALAIVPSTVGYVRAIVETSI